jgi:hypothetical protein
MYRPQSTPLPEEDPLAIEVCLGLNERPQHVDAELANRIEATVATCGDVPSEEAIMLFAAAGMHIQERVHGKAAADGHMAELLCWAAIQHDCRSKAAKWFDGRRIDRIWLYDFNNWIRVNEVGPAGYVGCLAPAIRRVLHVAPDFAPYWFARQGAPKPPPTKRRRGAPPPPTELGGGYPPPPPLPLGAPELNPYATMYFPDQLQGAVAKAHITADQQFRSELKKLEDINERKLADLRRQWFWSLLLGFAAGVLDMVRAGTYKVRAFQDSWPGFFREAAGAAGIKWHWAQVDAELKSSPKWEEFEKIRLEILDGAKEPQGPSPKGQKRGPKSDLKAARVAEIVNRIAPDEDWRRPEKMDEIEPALDEEKIPVPRRWGRGSTWADSERRLAIQAIEYRLKIARKTLS